MKILVIDDDRGLRKSLTLILTDAGYEVRVAEDGEEGSGHGPGRKASADPL